MDPKLVGIMKTLIKIHEKDNIAIALVDYAAGAQVEFEGRSLALADPTKAKHKIALEDFKEGAPIYMYGVLVGKAVRPIPRGGLLTTENVKHQIQPTTGRTEAFTWSPPNVEHWRERTFLGYHRPDGQVGTANVWLFFPLVFCENRNIEVLREVFEKELAVQAPSKHQLMLRSLLNPGVGTQESEPVGQKGPLQSLEVKFITHQGGCGGIRQDSQMLAKLLAGYVNNPNVAGATVLSLGCQNLQIDIFKKALEAINPDLKKPVLIYEQQKMGTVENMLSTIISESFEAIKEADKIQRRPAPLSKLKLGLECGGSDGFSGISANPVLGYTSDILAALGGSPILAEFPELSGVEQELVNRCVHDSDGQRFLQLMRDYERSVIEAGSGFDMNPSPGNIKDGLITDAMKSAGAAKKGGTSPVTAVLDYGEYVTKAGLNLLCTPGNDVESTTALAGSGANMMVFTTGLGTPTGNPVTPVVKMSSNSELAARMPDIIDVDAGPVIKGEKSIEAMGEELLEFIIAVASGEKKTKATLLDQNDFIPWKRGVSL